MLRTQVFKLARATPSTRRAFSASVYRAAEGDTGAPRSGGVASSDAFTRREQASEAKYIREKEMESIKKIREKLKAQHKHLKDLEAHLDELESSKGGEQ
ncbi:hypothetical protein B0A52_01053 [Exophiala mesophila]|uniref:ATPase inhibitor, mitochondrial n=1 Tax=Exophiala mesophila TaxID=212818 RepID=A0A438NGE0_EXOME|nr:hypothetical protein B0A52_01053 [Exophiala mesophila]